jgi:hypothetical protein
MAASERGAYTKARRPMRGRCLGGAIALLVVVAACSGSDDADSAPSNGTVPPDNDEVVAELVGMLPGDASSVSALDVAALRYDLGLPDDQAIPEYEHFYEHPAEATSILYSALTNVALWLRDSDLTPIREEFDTGAVAAAASAEFRYAPEEAVVVVRTSQSFNRISSALEDHGYERDGDLVVINENPVNVGVTAVASAGDDTLVLAWTPEVARAVAEGQGDGPALTAVLDAVDGPFRAAFSAEESDTCIETGATGWEVEPAEGEIVITVAEQSDVNHEALIPNNTTTAGHFDVLESEAEGLTIRGHFTYDETGGISFGYLFYGIPGDDGLYLCP